jgi:predicted Zn-dependent peptidase
MPFHTHRLPNGLELIGETSPSARSVAIGLYVRTGSRDETAGVSGVSHFLEHMVFKGTPRRSALDVNLDFDRIGASNNAFTSTEATLYYAAVLPEYLPEAVDILADILRPSLRQDDFDVEKKVIINEIKMYDDDPGGAAWERAQKIYFGDHPLGNSILGSPESITALSRDQMAEYFGRRYGASNVVAVAAGKFDWQEFVGLVSNACAGWEPGRPGRTNRTEWAGTGGLHVLTRERVQQEYVRLMSGGPPSTSPLRYAADTLALAVGDDSGSRLYWELVDPGKAESADSAYYEHDGTGTFHTTYSCEPEQAEENLAVVRRVLAEVQREGITEEELRQAKSKIASRVVRGSERPMGRMQAIAAAWTYTGEYRDVDTELANYDAVTLKDVRAVLDRYPLDRSTVVAFGPLKEIGGVSGKEV